jgi:hypothetical protein
MIVSRHDSKIVGRQKLTGAVCHDRTKKVQAEWVLGA